jgi:hypothetical protein
MEVSMELRLTMLASAALLLPAAAMAQDMQPTTAAPATQPQSTTPAQSDATAQTATTTAATTKATKADVKTGASIFDTSGNSVGKIESVSAKGAVLNTGKVKVTVPISSLAKSDKGLVIAMTKTEIEAAAKKSG